MSDRAALIDAIRSHPKEQTPRLVYADWLEEFGTCDLDTATVEFIRVSCSKDKPGLQMPRAAYEWIESNWRRLIPTVFDKYPWYSLHWAKRYVAVTTKWVPFWQRCGRTIRAAWRVNEQYRHVAVEMEFTRGFLSRLITWSVTIPTGLTPFVIADQPFITQSVGAIAADIPDSAHVGEER